VGQRIDKLLWERHAGVAEVEDFHEQDVPAGRSMCRATLYAPGTTACYTPFLLYLELNARVAQHSTLLGISIVTKADARFYCKWEDNCRHFETKQARGHSQIQSFI
jgi:hypothetical protein